ncbi:VCBS repeat-containing protein [Roseobacter denitrificans]|uniref:FG-GAP repeat domain protein n=1 Tax=Roseobacter denitrificans (strain ATCC 33942 / OCh 114) TaxID=375451 RepID=Q168Q7_ROSDO|nr:VCBS repeat-containing protein [Roseobacter denitrificans]ABG31536.1 FG-GAP repeat domain protein [Roseobacter denitrificans OCh 114]AVL54534.1 VCBS repeat-containing protein [Roseobacter denitrificans]SFF90225.1 Repeat domain-containing protein [Roseobacter denitrificans OCh 114]
MPAWARRLLARCLHRFTRRALPVLCLLQGAAQASEAIVSAKYEGPTDRYAHAVLGDGIEHETLVLTLADGTFRRFTLPETSVFEDTEPRLADLDADGSPEVIVVQSDQSEGARLAVYDAAGLITATPYIGSRFRWLAPLGASDLDGDGRMEIAYIDRPHLAKTLRIWRYEDRRLNDIAALAGVTNHRIGERDIAGGIRQCDGMPEMIVAGADWQELRAVRFVGGLFETRLLGADTSRDAFAAAMKCEG